jgi:plasmid stabilization system protein ParE
MKSRYILAPEAAPDLVRIWRYIKKKASLDMADRVESVIRSTDASFMKPPETVLRYAV